MDKSMTGVSEEEVSVDVFKSAVDGVPSTSVSIDKLRQMRLEDLERYGSDVQVGISDSMTKILQDTKCINLGQTGSYLSDLASTTGNVTKQLSLSGAFKPLISVKKWLGRFDNIESRIDNLDANITGEKDKLNQILNGLYSSKVVLVDKVKELSVVQDELTAYVNFIKDNMDEDEDGLKLQASVNRLKVITTTVAITKQEIIKTVLVIKENKEVTAQLTEASENLLPIFKIMMMNILATKANSEAVKLRKALVETGNKLVVENAKQIETTADDLIEGRTTSLISASSITEANDILQRTIQKVIDSSKCETTTNLELIESLNASTKSISDLTLLSGN